MKKLFSALCLFLLSFMFCLATNEYEDKIESPYFKVTSADPENVSLPLIGTSVNVIVTDVIADVTIRQTYTNKGKLPVEAQYVFPGSSKSAVYRMTMTVNKRVIEAVVKEKEVAKQEYEKAKQEGKKASLLEQHRPNVFQMNVANIRPGDTIVVDFSYTELLVPEGGIYEYVFPTVVGPRYADSTGAVKDSWITNPFAAKNSKQLTDRLSFDITWQLNSGPAIKQLRAVSHETTTEYKSQNQVKVTLKNPAGVNNDKDFIMQYEFADKQLETGISLFKGKEENFFLLTMQPPKQVASASIPPREYIFIVDVSGSMKGTPLEISKKLMRNLLSGMRPVDKFNVLLFAASSAEFASKPVEANADNIDRALKFINKEEGNGNTELLPALKRALEMRSGDNTSTTVVIATDGFVTVEKEAFELVRNNIGNANFFPFGIGPDVNRFIIEGLAHVGGGEPFIVTQDSYASEKAEKFRAYIQTPMLTDIKVEYEGFTVAEVEPVQPGDMFTEKPLVIFGKWTGDPKGKVRITGKSGTGDFTKVIDVGAYTPAETNSALRYLWARHKIMILSDYNRVETDSAAIKEITQLGLKYNLLTDYTSFIAVDNEPITHSGASGSSVPEPHEWALIMIMLTLGGFLLYRSRIV